MADITHLFKATIKAVKVRQKAAQTSETEREAIFPKRPKLDDDFDVRAREIVKNVTTLKEFLLEHRKAYLSFGNYLDDGRRALTDVERDQLDVDAENYTKICHETLGSLKVSTLKKASTPTMPLTGQRVLHRQVVITLLEAYLKAVCRLHSEQRAIRIKRAVDQRRIGRLEPERSAVASSHIETRTPSSAPGDGRARSEVMPGDSGDTNGGQRATRGDFVEDLAPSDEAEDITEEDARQFMLENQQMYNEFSSMSKEVKRIESKVVEISKLQELFTEKVLEQDRDIDRINETVMNSTINVMTGNEDVREAMKNNAGLRVYILFFLLVMTFTMLFLDWYND